MFAGKHHGASCWGIRGLGKKTVPAPDGPSGAAGFAGNGEIRNMPGIPVAEGWMLSAVACGWPDAIRRTSPVPNWGPE
ncbi:hypothetical protein L210DRAFT_3530235 [Boletus edulis BED1]|uniref:Uncharacterized protein n=1 Tax=Boletus edulis BED1 TaxID=1328754 RepID=A0AAD4BZS4_BOLED|nr:hypothetical protein L210DRAFT_3530235 [Boletus edulis BED1]